MAKKTLRYFFKKLQFFNPAELTVMSFIFASLIGGFALFITEYSREVTLMVPVLQKTITQTTEYHSEYTQPAVIEDFHVYVKPTMRAGERFIDTLFTAVSALCVTGLTSTDFSQFTLTGQIITMILIQMGGLGIIVFTSLFAFAVMRGISEHYSFRTFMASFMDTDHNQVRDMLKYVAFYTLLFEGSAFLIMGVYLQWFVDPSQINNINPWWWSLFHSISAFNNAGFGLLNNNLMNFVYDPLINTVIALLIILGGLGYPVLIFLYAYMRGTFFQKHDLVQKALNQNIAGVASVVQVKVAIYATIYLLLLGTLVTLYVEWHNPIEANMNFFQKLMVATFQSVSTRTAGFNTVDIGALHVATLFLYCVLMFIGANPAGTAGGIKIPTVAVLYGYIKDWFRKPGQPIELLGRKISKFALSHAIRLFFFSTLFIGLIIFFVSYFERDYLITPDPTFNYIKVMFEVFSAFGTVGLSMGFTGGVTSFSAILTDPSKLLIILTMLFGRLGPLTILAALPWKRLYADHPLSPDHDDVERIQIG